MAGTLLRLLMICAFGLLSSSPLLAASAKPLRGVALVVGETDYVRLPALANPDKDARDIDHMLDDLGFDVTRVLDGQSSGLKNKITSFVEDAKDADVALVYYAGHGIEAGGKDYIMGTDADISSAAAASDTLISLDDVLAQLQKTVPVTIVLLDACRTNPFGAQQTLALADMSTPVPIGATGLEMVRGPAPVGGGKNSGFGMVVGFSASPGQSALDGPAGENSPYASALLQHLGAGGYSFGDIMTLVSQEVYVDTGARQLPWTNSSLSRVLYFGRNGDAPAGDDAQILGDRRKLLLQIATLPDQSKAYVEAVAAQEDLKLADLYSMLDIINGGKSNAGNDNHQALLGVAKRVREVLDDPILSAAPTDPELARLDALASKAIAAGAFQRAFTYRQQEAKRAAQMEKGLDTQQAQIGAQRQELAGVYARVAEAAMYVSKPDVEADNYKRAASESDLFDKSISIRLRLREANALADQADDKMDEHTGQVAIAMYQDVLKDVDQQAQPVIWADTQLRLGRAMMQTASRRSDQDLRKKGVEAERLALSVFKPETDVRRWRNATLLMGIGLQAVGYPLKDQVIPVLTGLLKVTDRSQAPLDWANAEEALAEMYFQYGFNVDSDTSQLDQAATAFRAAAAAAVRFDRGLNNYSLSRAAEIDAYVGIRKSDRAAARAGAAAARATLTFVSKKDSPLPWGNRAGDIGSCLIATGLFLGDDAMVKDGMSLTTAAEKLITRDKSLYNWSINREADGDALVYLAGKTKKNTKLLSDAAKAYDDAYEGLKDQGADWAINRPLMKKIAVLQQLGKPLSPSEAPLGNLPPPAQLDVSGVKLAIFGGPAGHEYAEYTVRFDNNKAAGLPHFVHIGIGFQTPDVSPGLAQNMWAQIPRLDLSPDSQGAQYQRCGRDVADDGSVNLYFGKEKFNNPCVLSMMAAKDAAFWEAVIAAVPGLVHAAAIAGGGSDTMASDLDQSFAAKPENTVIIQD